MKNMQRREETKKSILKAATVLIARNGYDGTGVAEICEKAGVSKGAFYYHFESKETVFLHLIDSWLSGLGFMLENVMQDGDTIPDMFMKMAGMMKGLFHSHNTQASLFLELWTQASRNDRIREATIAPYRKYRQIFSGLIEQGIKEGSLHPANPETASQAILSLASGMFLQGLLDPGGIDWDKTAEESLNIILEGLKRR